MATYYIDPILGKDEYDGLSATRPKKDYLKLNIIPGDSILFKRGSVYRAKLELKMGTDYDPITYGAYGEGEKPALYGSVANYDPSAPIYVNYNTNFEGEPTGKDNQELL